MVLLQVVSVQQNTAAVTGRLPEQAVAVQVAAVPLAIVATVALARHLRLTRVAAAVEEQGRGHLALTDLSVQLVIARQAVTAVITRLARARALVPLRPAALALAEAAEAAVAAQQTPAPTLAAWAARGLSGHRLATAQPGALAAVVAARVKAHQSVTARQAAMVAFMALAAAVVAGALPQARSTVMVVAVRRVLLSLRIPLPIRL